MRVTRTYLELTAPVASEPSRHEDPSAGFEVARVERPTPELYRSCYRTVGEAYHWRDRWDWSDAEIAAHLDQPGISIHLAREQGQFAGWYELRRVDDGSVEIAYFGLASDRIGRGLGRLLLSCAVRDAWALGATRVWLHTCSLDHPHALANYKARGFVPYRTEEYEVT
ncbi:MAG TPA: GNAT family N-acetyltransferase [Gemmatimonadales bacterium]|nr:GNAT family N-acetyltransferase [Gemmatimonadales bacterium]